MIIIAVYMTQHPKEISRRKNLIAKAAVRDYKCKTISPQLNWDMTMPEGLTIQLTLSAFIYSLEKAF